MDPFKELFRPGKINSLEIENRIVMAAIGNKLADEEGYVTDQAIDYYLEPARGGVGLIIVKPVWSRRTSWPRSARAPRWAASYEPFPSLFARLTMIKAGQRKPPAGRKGSSGLSVHV